MGEKKNKKIKDSIPVINDKMTTDELFEALGFDLDFVKEFQGQLAELAEQKKQKKEK